MDVQAYRLQPRSTSLCQSFPAPETFIFGRPRQLTRKRARERRQTKRPCLFQRFAAFRGRGSRRDPVPRQKSRQSATFRKMGAVHAHFLDRHVRIPGFQIDPANRVAKHADRETASQPIERRRPHTVVRREATDEQFVHIEFVQGRLEVPAAIGERLEGRRRATPAVVPRFRPRHPGDSLKGCGPDETLEIRDVVLPEREVRGQALKPSRLLHVGTRTRNGGRRTRDELGEVAVPHTAAVGKGLLENAREDGLQRVQARLLPRFAAQAVDGGLPFLQTATGGDPGVAPTGRSNMMDQEDATPPVMEKSARRPERVFGRPKRRVVRRDDDFPFLDRNPSEPVERIRESVLAHSGAHRPSQGWEAYLTPPRVSGPRTEGSRVPLEDVSDRANKVYDTMKSAGITSEDKMRDAEAITKMSKLPKNFVLQALQELQSKGYAKRRAREKAAGYWLIK